MNKNLKFLLAISVVIIPLHVVSLPQKDMVSEHSAVVTCSS